MAHPQQPRPAPSGAPSIARQVMEAAVTFHLANGGPATARANVDKLSCLLMFLPDSREAYLEAMARIAEAEEAEQARARESRLLEQDKLIRTLVDMVKAETQTGRQDGRQSDCQAAATGELPLQLFTGRALAVWKRLQDVGLVDDCYQPLGLSRSMSAVMAQEIGDALQLSEKWKPFEMLWGRNNMKADYNRGMGLKKAGDLLDRLKPLLAEFRVRQSG